MKTVYETSGTCSRAIMLDVDDATGIVNEIQFVGGCMGNTQGVARLVEGMNVDAAIEKLAGIDCGGRGTSCPDQLARALKQYMSTQN